MERARRWRHNESLQALSPVHGAAVRVGQQFNSIHNLRNYNAGIPIMDLADAVGHADFRCGLVVNKILRHH